METDEKSLRRLVFSPGRRGLLFQGIRVHRWL